MMNRAKISVTPYELRWWGLAALLLLASVVLRILLYRTTEESEAYLRHVADVVASTPPRFESWVALDAPVPTAAVTMLRPNVLVSRKYTNLASGQQATLLLVQCRDARDLLGHYPPVCYVASGFRLVASHRREWRVDGLAIEGIVYTFSSTRAENLTSMVVYDIMLLPEGRTCRDMEGDYAAARDPRRRQLGAAQLQILVDPTLSEQEREDLFLTLVKANRKTIDAILAGDKS
jgi:hypothetical protein